VTDVAPVNDASKASQSSAAAPADASNKLAEDLKGQTSPKLDKQAEAKKDAPAPADSGFDLGSYVSGALDSAGQALTKMASYLPNLQLTSGESSKNEAVQSQHTTDAVVTALAKAKESGGNSAGAAKDSNLDLKYMNDTITLDDLLKSQGCGSTSKSCTISPAANMTGGNSGADYLAGMTVTKAKATTTMGGSQSELQTLIGDNGQFAKLSGLFTAETGVEIKASLTSDTKAPPRNRVERPKDDERVEKTASGYRLMDKNGAVDVERKGDLSIKHNTDGSTSELNTKTGEEIRRGADGKIQFKRLVNGDIEYPLDGKGDRITFSHDGKQVRVLNNGVEKTYDISKGRFDLVTSDTVIQASDSNLPNGQDLVNSMASIMSGKYTIEPMKNGMKVVNADGSMIAVANDGTGTISLDKHSTMVRRPDGHIEIFYNDNRPAVLLTDAQVKKLTADPAVGKNLKEAFEALRNFSITGILEKTGTHGTARIAKINGLLVGSVNGVLATRTADGKVEVDDTNKKEKTTVDPHHLVINNPEGKVLAQLGITGQGVNIEGTGINIRNGVATTEDGTVYGPEGIHFADGTDFRLDGGITDKYGTTFNPSGEIIAPGKGSGSSSSDSTEQHEEQAAHAKVTQAEGMAASIAGHISSGHATAGEIAALYGALDKLTNLVGSLAQFPDAGLMAAALMAKDAVSGSIEIAYASLNTTREKTEERDNMTTAPRSNAISNNRVLAAV